MSRYVKLEDAIERTNQFYHGDEVEAWLESLPTTEIVHCKDCVHCADDWNGNQPQFTCELGLCGESVYPDDYCSYGEKQVASKLKNPDDSLFTEELETCKEQKSKLESDDAVSKAVFDQIKWERDTALQTLEEHGIGLGERKVDTPIETPTNTPTDLISRQAAIDLVSKYHRAFVYDSDVDELIVELESLPPVTPTEQNEEDILKFYYVESLDEYWIGQRCGTRYYGKWTGNCFTFTHSRYLPWGEHVVSPDTLWKEHTYPSEPKEIPFNEWLQGFSQKECQPERPKGEWIDKNGWSYCSNCERKAIPQSNGCEIEPCHTPFCTWCVADMRRDKK